MFEDSNVRDTTFFKNLNRMKKFYAMIVTMSLSAMSVYAETKDAPVLGTDYKWVYIDESVTEFPADFCEGVAKADAETKLKDTWAIGAIYGNLPTEGNELQVLKFDMLDETCTESTMTWEAIVAAVADWDDYYYPARLGESSLVSLTAKESVKTTKKIVDGRVVLVCGNKQYNLLGVEMK